MTNRAQRRHPDKVKTAVATATADTVVIGFLHPQNYIAPEFSRSLLRLFVRDAYLYPGRILGPLEYVSSANISSGRNELVQQFLASGADWLLMIDADMTFGPELLDLLLQSADADERPIMGGLCFGVKPLKVDGVDVINDCFATPFELFPTIYTQDPENEQTIHWNDYPKDSVFQVHSTGGACLLVHRKVLVDPRWLDDGHPFPWFRESVLWGKECSEDHFFLLKAGAMGYPCFVDSRAKTGHVKSFVADEDLFLGQLAARAVQIEPLSQPCPECGAEHCEHWDAVDGVSS